ncbi:MULTISPECIES: MCE family protein [unclassified Nocardioides]|jgi:phospholipid/cholesterol/gamma-HCH transport system substrate-binding protein|uniref:MCE family protein n=1 Tax=unclassified Nocardioides TaxID=2615069 RepID=UPI00138F6A7E|nr:MULTISPECIES: MCE family protein [unclassified Nocardioides]
MTMRTTTARAALVGVLALGVGATSACGTTMRDLPIPGTGVSGDTIEVKAQFDEALNLAIGAPVKVNGVDMGKVKDVTVDDFIAEATLTLKSDAELHEGAHARLRYTTPLGELFVDVTNPATGNLLGDNATLELKDTETAPTVEDALAQASLLINGGGLEQLQTVTEELNTALNGNEGDYRTLLDRASVFLTQANSTSQSIDAVLTSLNSLSKTLNSRKDTINRAVREIAPAAKVLREKTPQFTELLAEVEKFTGAANETVTATRSQLLTLLKEIEPVLAEFAKNNGTFDTSLQRIIKASSAADNIIATDYLNIKLELHLDGIDAGGLVQGTLGGILKLLGLDPNAAGIGGLLDNLGLGNLLGGRTTTTKPATSGKPKPSGTSSGSGGSHTGSDPLGLNALLSGLLGGGR